MFSVLFSRAEHASSTGVHRGGGPGGGTPEGATGFLFNKLWNFHRPVLAMGVGMLLQGRQRLLLSGGPEPSGPPAGRVLVDRVSRVVCSCYGLGRHIAV